QPVAPGERTERAVRRQAPTEIRADAERERLAHADPCALGEPSGLLDSMRERLEQAPLDPVEPTLELRALDADAADELDRPRPELRCSEADRVTDLARAPGRLEQPHLSLAPAGGR